MYGYMKCLGPIELPKHTLQCVTLCIKTIRTPFDVIVNAEPGSYYTIKMEIETILSFHSETYSTD